MLHGSSCSSAGAAGRSSVAAALAGASIVLALPLLVTLIARRGPTPRIKEQDMQITRKSLDRRPRLLRAGEDHWHGAAPAS
jgi:hypothetical protein